MVSSAHSVGVQPNSFDRVKQARASGALIASSISSSPSPRPLAALTLSSRKRATPAGNAPACSTVSFGSTSACCTSSTLVRTRFSLAAWVTRWMSFSVSARSPTSPAIAPLPLPAPPESSAAGISTLWTAAAPASRSSVLSRRAMQHAPLVIRSRCGGVLDLHPQRLEADLLHDEVVLRHGVVPLVELHAHHGDGRVVAGQRRVLQAQAEVEAWAGEGALRPALGCRPEHQLEQCAVDMRALDRASHIDVAGPEFGREALAEFMERFYLVGHAHGDATDPPNRSETIFVVDCAGEVALGSGLDGDGDRA